MKKYFEKDHAVFLIFFVFAVLLRIWTAATSFNMVYPDEHFQVVEPANWVVFGYGWKSWEWYWGIRSWLIPALYMPLLFAYKVFGGHGGPVVVFLCRLWTTLFSAFALWRFHLLLRRRGLSVFSRALAVGAFCFSTAMIAWSATSFSETWSMICLWGFLPEVFHRLERQNFRDSLMAGIFVGILFALRIQMGAWIVGFSLPYLFIKSERKTLWPLALGVMIPILAQGILDWFTWGHPFHSTYMNVKMNIFEGIAEKNGASPWYAYFQMIFENLGQALCVVFFGVILAAGILRLIQLKRSDLQIALGTLVFFTAHSFISHKEPRFLLPIYPAFFYFFSLAVEALAKKFILSAKMNGLQKVNFVSAFLIAGIFSVYALPRVFSPQHHATYDLSDLTSWIYFDGGLKTEPKRCLLLADSFWVWTRGETALGQKVIWVQSDADKIQPEPFQNCKYALIPAWAEEKFLARGRELNAITLWHRLHHDRWGNFLYKNEGQ